jgi:hypothetical protein
MYQSSLRYGYRILRPALILPIVPAPYEVWLGDWPERVSLPQSALAYGGEFNRLASTRPSMLFSVGTEQKSRGVTITVDFDTIDGFSNYIASLLFFCSYRTARNRVWGQVGRSVKTRPVLYGKNTRACPFNRGNRTM